MRFSKFLILGIFLMSSAALAATFATITWDPVTKDIEGNPERIDKYEIAVTLPDGAVQAFESRNPTFETPDFAMPGTYTVRVRAVDEAGNRSDFSVPATFDVRDTVPPAPPTGVRCIAGQR